MMAPRFQVRAVIRGERDVPLRLPFRYGMVTLTAARQAFVRVRIRCEDGREGWGQAAELMAPKWFDKAPDLSHDDNVEQLRRAIAVYADAICSNGPATAYGHHAGLYASHLQACAGQGLNGLVAGYGPALVDRAALDALCRLEGTGFWAAMRGNLPGFSPAALADDLAGLDVEAFLAGLAPLDMVAARHTVGLTDALTAADRPAADRIDDGLPETLEEVVEAYGQSHFKLKVGGDVDADLARLRAIAAVLDRTRERYSVTLDGNEQYRDAGQLAALVAGIAADPTLGRFRAALLFIEQPLDRAVALDTDIAGLDASYPVIIDESDADLSAFPQARRCGYRGVSSKSCKGFYKALTNLARCRVWAEGDGEPYFMSAEDLSCQPGLALQQDLALVALLGISHVERNGHHYGGGMAEAPEAERRAFAEAHPGLYRSDGGRCTLRIDGGRIAVGALGSEGYGGPAPVDWDAMDGVKTIAGGA